MSEIVQNQYSSWQAENSAKFIYNGFIYVGQVDTDPLIEANRVRVYYIDENEQEVDLTQPIRTNSSGFPVVSETSSKVIQIRTDSDYSVKVLNKKGAQEWYIPKASSLSPVIGIDNIPGLREELKKRAPTLTIDEAKLSDLYLGEYVILKDRGFALFEIVATNGSEDDYSRIKLNSSISLLLDENELLNVTYFGVTGDGDEDDKINAAFSYAQTNGIKLKCNLKVTCKKLTIRRFGGDYWDICGKGEISATEAINFLGCQYVRIKGLIFKAPNIYIQGFRYSSMTDVKLQGLVNTGRHDFDGTPDGGSWSIYWSEFTKVLFGSLNIITSTTDSNFNSNMFQSCEFRDTENKGALFTFDRYADRNNPVFASNTFDSCDFSYAPVFDVKYDYGKAFSITIVGGYLDSGTPWLKDGSFKPYRVDVLGLRNPGSSILSDEITASITSTAGGARTQTKYPVSAVSVIESFPDKIEGTKTYTIKTVNLPFDGEYSFSSALKGTGEQIVWKFENKTTGEEAFMSLPNDGFGSFTFKANENDIINFIATSSADTDVDVKLISCTAGAAVYDSVPISIARGYNQLFRQLNVTSAVTAFSLNIGTFQNDVRTIEFVSRDPDAAGGCEMVVVNVAMASGGSAVNATISEVSRVLVNGPGGTGDDPAPMIITTSTTGTTVNISVASSGSALNIQAKLSDDKSFA